MSTRSRFFHAAVLTITGVLTGCAVEPITDDGESSIATSEIPAAATEESLSSEELSISDREVKDMRAIMVHLRGGKTFATLPDDQRQLAADAFAATEEIEQTLHGYPAIRAVLSELQQAGVEPIDYIANLDLSPTAKSREFLQEAYSFHVEWRTRHRAPDVTGDLALAPAPAEPVTLTVISIAVGVGGIVATFVQMSGMSNETMVEVPRWVCSDRRFDRTILYYARAWFARAKPVYRGWVCSEIQCLVTHVPESLVPNIKQCPMVGQRHAI